MVSSLNLKFDDVDELREHPMLADKCDLKFDDIFGMVFGTDRSHCADFSTDLSGLDKSKLNLDDKDSKTSILHKKLRI